MAKRLSYTLFSGALLFYALSPAVTEAATQQGTCNPTKVKFIASSGSHATTSTAFVNVPEAAISFTQGGTKPTCVIVEFSSHAWAQGDEVVHVRAFMDNSVAALPDSVQFSSGDGIYNAVRSYKFVFPSVTPGLHALRMQFHTSAGTPTSVTLSKHNTFIYHAP